MMKKLLLILLLLGTRFAIAQKLPFTGMVRNTDGAPVRGALIEELKGSKTKTDSAGVFNIRLNIPATIHISAVGYKDTSFVADHQYNLAIILKFSVIINASRDRHSQQENVNVMTSAATSNMVTQMESPNTGIRMSDDQPVKVQIAELSSPGHPYMLSMQKDVTFDAAQGAILPQFNPKEETHGSRYYYMQWVSGWIINTKGQMLADPKYMYNYDKMTGALLATQDGRSAIEVDRNIVKYFSLTNGTDTVSFANIPGIDNNHYVQVVTEGNKYGIYKAIKTKFERANYTTDGVMTQGNNYDEYIDEPVFYMMDVQTGKIQQVLLKKKALKALFAKDADKVNKFMSDHSSDSIDDSYLASLGAYMNE